MPLSPSTRPHVRTLLAVAAAATGPAILAGSAFAGPGAPTELSCSDAFVFSTPEPIDFLIPDRPGDLVRLIASGADGGEATAGTCDAQGGDGATATGLFRIGDGPAEIAPGGTLRFIVGQRGEDHTESVGPAGFSNASAGGGGGTGVLYDALNDGNWVPLVVAGGGGGGWQATEAFACQPPDSNIRKFGMPGHTGPCGTTREGDAAVGCGGNGAQSYNNYAGPGGGVFTGGVGAPNFGGGGAGIPAGGAGGVASNPESGNGGWGCGGGGSGSWSVNADGGGGGGGGGYSGGAIGALSGGGGGGSFVDDMSIDNETSIVEGSPAHAQGHASYQIVGGNEFAVAGYPIELDVPVTACFAPTSGTAPLGCSIDTTLTALWWSYQNTTEYARTYLVTIQSSDGSPVDGSVHDLFDLNNPDVCFGPSGSGAFVIQPGEWRFIRALANAPSTIVMTEVTLDDDGDGIPDGVDVCFGDNASGDLDGDGICNDSDPYPTCFGGIELEDFDFDGIPDVCDNCVGTQNTLQFDRTHGAAMQDAALAWRFDGGFDDRLGFDSIGGLHAESLVGASRTQGRFGEAISFAGTNDVRIPAHPSLDFGAGEDFTVSLHVAFPSNTGPAFSLIESSASPNGAGPFPFRITGQIVQNPDDPTSSPYVNLLGTVHDGTSGTSVSTSFARTGFDFVHIALVRRAGVLELHVLGELVASNANMVTGSTSAGAPVQVGSRAGSARFFGGGAIDELIISPVALTGAELLALAELGLGDGNGDACDPLPVNDEPCNAIPIAVGETLAFDTRSASTTEIPLSSFCDEGSGIAINQDLWYELDLPDSFGGVIRVSTCGSGFDTRLALYEGPADCSQSGGGLFEYVCNDDDGPFCNGENASFILDTELSGAPLYVRLGSNGPGGTGTLTFEFEEDCFGLDSDGDGVNDCDDICPGFDDSIDTDGDGIPDGCDTAECLGDLDGSGEIDFGDLVEVLSFWGPCPGCPADLDVDGQVNFDDLLYVLSFWGGCGI